MHLAEHDLFSATLCRRPVPPTSSLGAPNVLQWRSLREFRLQFPESPLDVCVRAEAAGILKSFRSPRLHGDGQQ